MRNSQSELSQRLRRFPPLHPAEASPFKLCTNVFISSPFHLLAMYDCMYVVTVPKFSGIYFLLLTRTSASSGTPPSSSSSCAGSRNSFLRGHFVGKIEIGFTYDSLAIVSVVCGGLSKRCGVGGRECASCRCHCCKFLEYLQTRGNVWGVCEILGPTILVSRLVVGKSKVEQITWELIR